MRNTTTSEAHRNKTSTTVYLRPDQRAGLRALSTRTRVPVAELVRLGVDSVLNRGAACGDVGAQLASGAAPVAR